MRLPTLVKPVWADVDIGSVFEPVKNSQSLRTLGGFLNVVLPNILLITGIIAFVSVIATGIKMISDAGEGESEKATKDKEAFTAAVIGLIIVFGAYFIVQIVSTVVGYNFLSPPIP